MVNIIMSAPTVFIYYFQAVPLKVVIVDMTSVALCQTRNEEPEPPN